MTDRYDDHTLQINTFNRPVYLFRTLKYVSEDLPVGRVQVIDGSVEPFRTQNRDVIAGFADRMQIEHIQLDQGIDAISQTRLGIQAIGTAYATRCDDDNFVTPSSLRHAVEFLRAEPDYAVCSGIVVYLSRGGGRISVAVHDAVALEQDDPLDRLACFLANHWSADFATWRTDVRRSAARALDMYNRDETMGEPLWVGVGTLHGKLHVLAELGTVFCNHGDNLGIEAHSRQHGPASPAFGDNLTAAGDLISTYCQTLGIPEPEDARLYYLEAYLSYIAKWHDLFASIGDKIRRSGTHGLGREVLDRHDAAVEDEILSTLIGLPDSAIRAIRADQAACWTEGRTANYEALSVFGDTVVLRDCAEHAYGTDVMMPVPSGRVVPELYRAFVPVLADRDWAGVMSRFQEQAAETVLGEHAAHPVRDSLFRGAFSRGLARLLRPLNTVHPSRPDHWIRCLALAEPRDPQCHRLLKAVAFFNGFASPAMRENLHRQGSAGDGGFEIIQSRPPAGARQQLVRINVASIARSVGVTFIPLDLRAPRRAWLGIRLSALRGRMQFGLYSNGAFDCMAIGDEREGAGELFLPVLRAHYDYLIIRDLAHGALAGGCQIAALCLYVSPDVSAPAVPAASPRACA